jgi:hypothetical protein
VYRALAGMAASVDALPRQVHLACRSRHASSVVLERVQKHAQ